MSTLSPPHLPHIAQPSAPATAQPAVVAAKAASARAQTPSLAPPILPPRITDRGLTGPDGQPLPRPADRDARILIVEDEAIIALALENALTRAGHEVAGIADNSETALEMCRRATPDLVLMDISIRGDADGIDTAAAIIRDNDVPVVFLTAYGDDATLERASQVSPYGYIIKPYDERSLLVTVRIAIERHRSDARLRLLQHAISEANIGILLVDIGTGIERRITYANEAFLAMSGASREQVVGRRPCFLALNPEDPAALRLRDAVDQQRTAHEIIAGRNSEGRVFWSSVTISPIVDRTGKATHAIIFHLDVTREREAERIAAASQRMDLVGRLAAGTAHDFNNILGVIMAFSEMAQNSSTDDAVRADLEEISTAAHRGTELTRKLMSLTRPSENEVRQFADIGRVLADAHRMIERAAGPGVRTRIECAPQPMGVPVDPGAMEQVLLNLVLNARDAMPNGGNIVIRAFCPTEASHAFPPAQYVRIEVADTGVGMHPDIITRIFEPLFTTKTEGRGTGLGLPTCKRIVEDGGGHMGVRSTPGAGTNFVIDLPRLGWIDRDDNDPIPDLAGAATGRVCLVVEDDQQLRRASVRALAAAGFEVHESASGEVAIRKLDEIGSRLDLVACDVILPGISGAGVLAHARRTAPHAALLVLTGYLDASLSGLGPDIEILWKPYAPSALARRAIAAVGDLKRPERPALATPTPQPEAPLGPPPSEKESAGLVLLVDDDDACRRAYAALLQAREIDCVAVGSGEEAHAALARHDFDAIITELRLPDVDGFELLTQLRARAPFRPIVVMSDMPSMGAMQRALQLRAFSFISKPCSSDDLVGTIASAVQEGQVKRVQHRLLVIKSNTAETFSDLRATEQRFAESLAGLFMVYQPIVRGDGAIFGYEALLRTCGPYGNPLEFLAVAEALGRIEELGRAARRAISQTLSEHPERTEPIFVNIHPLEFRVENLARRDEPLAPWSSRVILEVTERAQLGSANEVAETLRVLREKGFRFALDDLGEGYAGLSWLVKLAPEVTKIDMSLIRGIESDAMKRDAVASLVNICRRAHAFVVAEGVENQSEARCLRDLGCDLLQGYFFARPGAPFPAVHLIA